jgi:methylmalonyl-CoA mutase cobalamin-binding subunit
MAGEGILLVIETAASALRDGGVDYALIGGAAMPAWGRARATQDADILVALASDPSTHETSLKEIVDRLRSAGFAHLDKADRKQLGGTMVLHFWFPLRDRGFSVRMDLLAAPGPDFEEVVTRAVLRKVDGFSVSVASCEDLILLKLAAGRVIDLADAKDLLVLNAECLDCEYLEARAQRRGLSRELAEARAG